MIIDRKTAIFDPIPKPGRSSMIHGDIFYFNFHILVTMPKTWMTYDKHTDRNPSKQPTSTPTHQTIISFLERPFLAILFMTTYAIELYSCSIFPEELFDDGTNGSLFGFSSPLLDSSKAFM